MCYDPRQVGRSGVADGLAFIFDLDGVVVDSMPLHTEAWREYLRSHGISRDDVVAGMHGRRNDEIVVEFFGQDLTPRQVFEHGAMKEALFREMMESRLEEYLVAGIRTFLAKYEDVPAGLASNAERANIDFVLDKAGLRDFFKVIVDGGQVKRPKPFPDPYIQAAAMMGIEPRNCIIFEDSPTGIEAAVQSGARVVAVQTHTGDLPAVDFQIRDFLDPELDTWLQSREYRG